MISPQEELGRVEELFGDRACGRLTSGRTFRGVKNRWYNALVMTRLFLCRPVDVGALILSIISALTTAFLSDDGRFRRFHLHIDAQ